MLLSEQANRFDSITRRENLMSKKFNTWFKTFLEEKQLPHKSFDIEHDGEQHIIDSDFIINLIQNCSDSEQASIKNTLVKIDFHNGNVHHFFEHLATGYVKTNY